MGLGYKNSAMRQNNNWLSSSDKKEDASSLTSTIRFGEAPNEGNLSALRDPPSSKNVDDIVNPWCKRTTTFGVHLHILNIDCPR